MKQSIIDGAAAGKLETVYVDFGGSATRATLLGADAEGILVKARGMEMRITWPSLKPARFYGIARKYCEDKDVLEYYRLANGIADDNGR